MIMTQEEADAVVKAFGRLADLGDFDEEAAERRYRVEFCEPQDCHPEHYALQMMAWMAQAAANRHQNQALERLRKAEWDRPAAAAPKVNGHPK